MALKERTIGGVHDFLNPIIKRYAVRGGRAIDLGAGSGALSVRLCELGFEVVAADMDREAFKADVPFVQLNLNKPDLHFLNDGQFDLVTAVEVIEHLESPIEFMRTMRSLLKPDGIAVITTPNMDSVPSRFRFLLTGKLHMMDEKIPNHISPMFYDLFTRVYLPRAGFELIEHHLYPPNSYKVSRKSYSWIFRLLAGILPGDSLFGDIHVFVLQAIGKKHTPDKDEC